MAFVFYKRPILTRGLKHGVIRAAVEAGKRIHVFADETRPLLQGARLTMTELLAEGIPATLILR